MNTKFVLEQTQAIKEKQRPCQRVNPQKRNRREDVVVKFFFRIDTLPQPPLFLHGLSGALKRAPQ